MGEGNKVGDGLWDGREELAGVREQFNGFSVVILLGRY